MGCLELFLSEVSSGVLAPLKDGLALCPASRQFYTFSSVVSLLRSLALSLSSSLLLPWCSLSLSRSWQRASDFAAPESERVFVFSSRPASPSELRFLTVAPFSPSTHPSPLIAERHFKGPSEQSSLVPTLICHRDHMVAHELGPCGGGAITGSAEGSKASGSSGKDDSSVAALS